MLILLHSGEGTNPWTVQLSGSVYCLLSPTVLVGVFRTLSFTGEESTVPEQPRYRFFLTSTVNTKRWMMWNQDVPV